MKTALIKQRNKSTCHKCSGAEGVLSMPLGALPYDLDAPYDIEFGLDFAPQVQVLHRTPVAKAHLMMH